MAKWLWEAIDTTDGGSRVQEGDGQQHRYVGDVEELATLQETARKMKNDSEKLRQIERAKENKWWTSKKKYRS